MKTKNLFILILLGMFILAASSCNRGVGCPGELSTDFSVESYEIE